MYSIVKLYTDHMLNTQCSAYVNIRLFLDVFFASRRRHTSCALVIGVQTCALPLSSPSARRRANSRWSAMVEARTNVAVGDTLPELVRGPIDRATLALFAGASHDHVRLHIDSDFAHTAGKIGRAHV